MPDLNDYLLRFRRLLLPPGAPGQRSPMPSGPPGLDDELQPIFAAIERIEDERRQLEAQAEQESLRIRQEADEACEQRLDEARRQADEGYAEAHRERSDELTGRFRDLMAEARAEAERVEREGSPRAKVLADDIAQAIIDRAYEPVAPSKIGAPERSG